MLQKRAGFSAFVFHACRRCLWSLAAGLKQNPRLLCCSSRAYSTTLEICPVFCMWVHRKMANPMPFLEHMLFWTLQERMAIGGRCSCPYLCRPSPIKLRSSLPFPPGSGSHLALRQGIRPTGNLNFQPREALMSRWRGCCRRWNAAGSGWKKAASLCSEFSHLAVLSRESTETALALLFSAGAGHARAFLWSRALCSRKMEGAELPRSCCAWAESAAATWARRSRASGPALGSCFWGLWDVLLFLTLLLNGDLRAGKGLWGTRTALWSSLSTLIRSEILLCSPAGALCVGRVTPARNTSTSSALGLGWEGQLQSQDEKVINVKNV